MRSKKLHVIYCITRSKKHVLNIYSMLYICTVVARGHRRINYVNGYNMTKKLNKKDNAELVMQFFTLSKTLQSIEKTILKYKDAELHAAMAKMYKGMEEFSARMIELSLEVSDDYN